VENPLITTILPPLAYPEDLKLKGCSFSTSEPSGDGTKWVRTPTTDRSGGCSSSRVMASRCPGLTAPASAPIHGRYFKAALVFNPMSLSLEEKRKFLKALREDDEFRHAVAGAIGYGEILERLAEHDKKFNEIIAEIRAIEERLAEHDKKFNEIIAEIRAIEERLAEHDKKFEGIDEKLTRIEATLERFALTLEDEGREVVAWLLGRRGIHVELRPLRIDDVEYDIYGETDDIVVIGEVKTRLSAKRVREFDDRVRKLLKLRPSLGRKRLIKVLYAMTIQPPALEEARGRGILVATAKGFVEGSGLN